MNTLSFDRLSSAIAQAALESVGVSAMALAEDLQGAGESATVSVADETATIIIAGETALAREFGTRTQSARPFAGVLLQAHRAAILTQLGKTITDTIRGRRA